MSFPLSGSAFLFRFRYLMHAGIYTLGFFAPWNRWLHLDEGRTTWLLVANQIGKTSWFSFTTGTVFLLVVAILLASSAAALRTWASAYLGPSIVQDSTMHGDHITSGGPYRYLRNPLYSGTLLHSLALAVLMPLTGAIVSLLTIGILQLRLIAGEESFLKQRLGASYVHYCQAVPSLLPALHAGISATSTKPQWIRGFLGESYMWGVAMSFLLLGWRYNAILILQGILVSLGLSLVVQAMLPNHRSKSPSTSDVRSD